MTVLAVDFQGGIEDAWSDIATFVPQFIAFLAVLLIGWIVARIITRIADKLIDRSPLDRTMARGGMKSWLDRTGNDAGDIVSKIVFYALMLIVLRLAFGVFGENAVSDVLAGVISYIPRVIAALLILVVAAVVAAAAKDMIKASMGELGYAKLVSNGAAVAIVAIGVFAALNQLRIAPAIVNGLFYALLAIVAGSAIVAIGGGGIMPMQQKWRQVLQRYDEEKPRMRQEMQHAREHSGDGHRERQVAGRTGGASSQR